MKKQVKTQVLWSSVLVLLLSATPAFAQQLAAQLFVTGLDQPVGFFQNPTFTNVQHVLEKPGRIRTIQNGVLLPTPFLDIVSRVRSDGEMGLLGLAFAPDYNTSGRFWVYYTNAAMSSIIARFRRSAGNALQADAASEFDLRFPAENGSPAQNPNPFIAQPFGNHKGGNIMFGPDGMLYVGLGDGGNANDPDHRAQNPLSLLGKMLRINVMVPDSDVEGYDIPPANPFANRADVFNEIWDFGMRNPWRWSFDDPARGGTGALIIGDVGQNAFEEIDYEPAGQGARNYGWRNREGAHDNITSRPLFSLGPATDAIWDYGRDIGTPTDPIYDYGRDVGTTVIGGVVYRGSTLTGTYRGRYFFADAGSNRVWSMGLTINPATGEATVAGVADHSASLGAAAGAVVSFGVDASGELYTVSLGGAVFRIVLGAAGPPPAGSCSTPDPFISLGGGTCVNGGWLPPFVAPPAAPAPPPPPPVSGGGGGICETPDPFTSLGGGTCFNGGWLPPGIAPPAGAPAPPAPAPTGPPAPPSPVPATIPCNTPDPFTSLGGGTCYNGGWLPPGISPPAGAPVPPPAPVPVPGGCLTPDPFVSIGGGRCVNGGWIPRGAGGTP